MEWLPIESAPRDGTLVFLYEPHSCGGFMFVGVLALDGVWRNNLDLEVQNPTHWMPLPPTPTD